MDVNLTVSGKENTFFCTANSVTIWGKKHAE